MLYFVDGDMWSRAANIHVNTVNCNGVMGKGVALAFARHYPKMLTEYRKATKPTCPAASIPPNSDGLKTK